MMRKSCAVGMRRGILRNYLEVKLYTFMFKGAHSRYFGHVQSYVYIEGNLKIVVHFYCYTIEWFSCECESKSKLLKPITKGTGNPMNRSQKTHNPVNQSQRAQAIQWTDHKGHRQSSESITKVTDNSVNQSQRTQTIQWTNHKVHRQSSEPITKGTDNPVNQSKLEVISCSWRKARQNVCSWLALGLGFTSDWIKKWRQFFKQIM